jgi:hypothetical protein
MDVVTQILGGLCVATGVAGMCRCRPAQRVKIILAGGIGGAIPDLDTMTIWPGFDQTIGEWLHLSAPGADFYFGQAWYSHQGFFHSLLGMVLITLLLWRGISYVYARHLRKAPSVSSAFLYLRPYFIAFGLGFGLHLLGDLFTPAGPWGGIRLFYPLDTFVGGWGKVWWWNNYDIGLIFILGMLMNLISLFFLPMLSVAGRYTPIVVFVCSLFLIGHQLNRRTFDYNRPGYMNREEASLTFQQQYLPSGLYHMMRTVDDHLPVYF